MNLNYNFTQKNKTLSFILIAIGIISLIAGFMTDDITHGNRVWANLLVNSFFFLGIAITGVFFVAMMYAAEAGWGVPLKRVFEGVSQFLPFAALGLIIVFAAGSLHWHHIYHWMDPEVHDPASPHFDALIAGKGAYLNQPFFWIRSLIYLGAWILFMRVFRKRSLEEDIKGGTELHYKNIKLAAWFLVLFAVTSSTSAWDWIMSIDTHWFSTLFGWYTFSGMWVSGVIMVILITLYLKKQGYLETVNESHIHDLGKWMFAISFLWSYLWFSQFMLIWYSNIPEEVTYYMNRIENFRFLFFGMFIINFIFPMLILMARDTKRNYGYLTFVGVLIFIGHWLDTYVMVMPGTLSNAGQEALISFSGIKFYEIGIALGFLGTFLFVVQASLAKAPLVVQNHPYLDEAIHQHT
jgi:hypothetical protein